MQAQLRSITENQKFSFIKNFSLQFQFIKFFILHFSKRIIPIYFTLKLCTEINENAQGKWSTFTIWQSNNQSCLIWMFVQLKAIFLLKYSTMPQKRCLLSIAMLNFDLETEKLTNEAIVTHSRKGKTKNNLKCCQIKFAKCLFLSFKAISLDTNFL